MKQEKQLRSKSIKIRLSEEEKNKLNMLYTSTTSNNLCEYVRDVILKRPVTVYYRNKSADEFLEEMIQLKNELNLIGKNFNQAVLKLHTLHSFDEIKAWTILNESSKNDFLEKTNEIKEKLSQIYEQWSQQ